MILVFLLALLQMAILPGLLFDRLLPRPILLRFPLIFMLSILANAQIVMILTFCRLYTRGVLGGVILLELGLLGWQHRSELRAWLSPVSVDTAPVRGEQRGIVRGKESILIAVVILASFALPLTRIGKVSPAFPQSWLVVLVLALTAGWSRRGVIANWWHEIRRSERWKISSYSFVWLAGGLCAGAVIVSYAIFFFDSYGTIFSFWDAIVSWNRWAADWSTNILPRSTWFYPQLLPANWSIAYVLTGLPFQFVPKIFMGFFFLGCAALLVQISLARRDPVFLFGLGVFYLIMQRQAIPINDGMADLPMAFFALCVIALMLFGSPTAMVNGGAIRGVFSNYGLSVLAACAAALTKQAGIFLLLMLPILVSWQQKRRINRSQFYLWSITVVILVVPWFLFCCTRPAVESSMIVIKNCIIQAHLGRNLWQRELYALQLIANLCGGVPVMIGSGAAILYSLRRPSWRPFLLLITIPYGIIWSYFFSYDIRNLFMVLPLAAVGFVIGLAELLRDTRILWRPLLIIMTGMVAVALILGLLSPSLAEISERHKSLQLNWYNKPVNRFIVNYKNEKKLHGKIATSYQILAFLPGMKRLIHLVSGQLNVAAIRNYPPFKRVHYVLGVPDDFTPESLAFIRKNLTSGEFTLLGEPDGWLFVEIR